MEKRERPAFCKFYYDAVRAFGKMFDIKEVLNDYCNIYSDNYEEYTKLWNETCETYKL